MRQVQITLLFLILNFGGLALGVWLMNEGPSSKWYISLNQAPWTPPGFIFGIAWSSIMILFSIYLGKLFTVANSNINKFIFGIQFVLNTSWNYLFFNQHKVIFALLILVLLTSQLFLYYYKYGKIIANYKYLLVPYTLWLCVATSLNLYILVHN
jgi:tryptophan-rich sensory protein